MSDEVSRPRQNRVTPFGEIEATPHRGSLMGNRGGELLAPDGSLGRRRWTSKTWIACRTEFRDRRVKFETLGHYTPLFFHDEAVALAAGHRPCGECRNADYRRFKDAWRSVFAHGSTDKLPVGEIDGVLHLARTRRKELAGPPRQIGDLPDGTFVTLADAPQHAMLVWHEKLHPWQHGGYGYPEAAPIGTAVTVITPAPMIAVLSAGYRPAVALPD